MEPNFQSAPSPAAGLRPDLVGGAAVYCSGEDALKLTVFNAAASVRVNVRYRFLPIDTGRVISNEFDLLPTTDRSLSQRVVALGEGWLLDYSIVASAGTPQIGQTFCILSIQRGTTTNGVELSTLAQGYVTLRQRIGTPSPSLSNSLDGEGALRSITGTDPGAGAEISETVPTGVRWSLLGMVFALASDATAPVRVVNVTIDDGALVWWRSGPITTQAASLTVSYGVGPAGAGWSVNGNSNGVPTPVPTILAAGSRIRTVTTNIVAGDNYGPPQYLVREWMEVNT